jgi:hypothetical protein
MKLPCAGANDLHTGSCGERWEGRTQVRRTRSSIRGSLTKHLEHCRVLYHMLTEHNCLTAALCQPGACTFDHFLLWPPSAAPRRPSQPYRLCHPSGGVSSGKADSCAAGQVGQTTTGRDARTVVSAERTRNLGISCRSSARSETLRSCLRGLVCNFIPTSC